MKRSDAIRLITAYCNFHTFKTVDEFSGDLVMTREEGEKVLNFIEELGMLPPAYKTEDSGHFPGDNFEYEINDWEPEDE